MCDRRRCSLCLSQQSRNSLNVSTIVRYGVKSSVKNGVLSHTTKVCLDTTMPL